MYSEAEQDQSATVSNLEITLREDGRSRGGEDSRSPLLAAEVVEFGDDCTDIYVTSAASEGISCPPCSTPCNQDGVRLELYPQAADPFLARAEEGCHKSSLENTVEVPTTVKKRPICVRIPIHLRKEIISMRKDGKKCVDVAKKLHVSVSGAQKVWERFLATGRVHDKRPTMHAAGRPRKYLQLKVQWSTYVLVDLTYLPLCAGMLLLWQF